MLEKPKAPKAPTIDELAEAAVALLLKDGEHIPVLMVSGTQGTVSVLVAVEGAASVQAAMYFFGTQLRDEAPIGKLTDLHYINEGWMVWRPPDKPLTVRPSQHPDRIEILIVAHLNVPHKRHDVRAFEMKRDKTGELREVSPVDLGEGGQTHAYVLDAFVDGWFGR